MEIQIDVNRKDYINFNKYYYKKGLKRRLIIVLIVVIGLPIFMNIGKPFELHELLINMIITTIVFSSVFLGIGYISIRRTGRLPSDKGSILGKKTITVTDEGLISESENSKTIQKWSGIRSIEQNDDMIFIFVDKIAAYIIPKRFFNDQIHIDSFLKKLDEKINAT